MEDGISDKNYIVRKRIILKREEPKEAFRFRNVKSEVIVEHP